MSSSCFTKFLNPTNRFLWIAVLFMINLVHFSIYHSDLNREDGRLFSDEGDASQYINATESLINGGDLVYMKTNDHLFYSNLQPRDTYDLGMYYAFRTPGFNLIHYPLRLVFDYDTSLNIMIVLQVLLNAVAKYLLCLLVFLLANKRSLFYLTILGFSFLFYLSAENNHLLTESLGNSFLVFSVFYFFKYYKSSNKRELLYSGCFLMLAYSFRPFLAPLFLFFVIYIFSYLKTEFLIRVKLAFIFMIPLLIFQTLWVGRNYLKTDEFIPVAATARWTTFVNKAFKETREVCVSLTIPPIWWGADAPLSWLGDEEDKRNPIELFGKDFFVDIGDTSKVILMKEMYLKSCDKIEYNLDQRIFFEEKSYKLIEAVHSKYKEAHPLLPFTKRVESFFKYFDVPIKKPFISIKYPLNVLTVFIESFFLRFITVFGFLGLLFLRNSNSILLLKSIPAVVLVIFSFFLVKVEIREAYIPLYFLTILSILFLQQLFKSSKLMILGVFCLQFGFVMVDMLNEIRW